MNNKILIIPAAVYKEKYKTQIPDIFKIDDSGFMNIIHNMNGLPLDEFEKIYITINKTINSTYNIDLMLGAQLELLSIGDKTEIIEIDKTNNVVETILETLKYAPNDTFGVFIKDADACFTINELNDENTVYTYLLEDVSDINPSSKSYVSKTSDDIILNIIEKRVISSEFCAGGYYFNNVNKFVNLCYNVKEYEKLYLSNVIYYDILNNGGMYRAEEVLLFNE